MKKFLRVFGILGLVLVSLASRASAQQFSGVSGVVFDKSGGTVSGVSVTLENTKLGIHVTTTTNDIGYYQFLRLTPAEGFELTFVKDSFRKFVLSNLTLGVGTVETRDVTLEVGSVTQSVEVQASGEATLNTSDATVGNVIGSKLIESLPVELRDSPAALLGLQPGVVRTDGNDPSGNRDGAVTGARADQGNITIDGIDANDQATGQAFATVGNAPIDAVQEFRGITAGDTSDLGRSSGAQIQLVTKSGSNDFHGNAYEYHRNTVTEANSFFNNKNGIARPALIRNQFGGSLGGRVIKDKLFFFFNYEGRRDASQDQELRIVPLDNVRNGILNYINNNPGCDATATLASAPQCISSTPATGPNSVKTLDPAGIGTDAALLTFVTGRYPAANDLTAGDGINTGGLRFNAPVRRANNTYTTRVDYNMTAKQKLFGRFNIVRSSQTDDINNVATQFPGDPAPASQITQRDYSFAIGHTWTISNTKINQAVFGIASSRLGFPAIFQPTFPNSYTFGSFSAPFPTLQSQFRIVPVPTIRDDFSWTKGHHLIQFGGTFKPQHQTSTQINDFNFVSVGLGGNLNSLNSSERPNNILSNPGIDPGAVATTEWDQNFPFLLGRFASVDTNFNLNTDGSAQPTGSPKVRNYRYFEYEGYVQDSWRVTSSFTFTYGLRYLYFSVPYETNGLQSVSDIGFQSYLNARVAAAAQGIEGDTAIPFLTYDLGGKANKGGRDIYNSDPTNFAPRIAFAYNPAFRTGVLGSIFGDRATVIRASGAIVHDRVNANTINFIQDQVSYLFNTSSNTPFSDLATDPRFTALGTLPVTNTPQPVTHPLTPFVSGGVPFGNATGQFNYTVDHRFDTPYAYTFSLGAQRQLPANFLLEVDYVGRLGRKLFAQADAGQVLNFKDNASGQFLFPAFNALSQQLRSGVAITPQPWFENQIGAGATQFIANALGNLVIKGDLSDTMQALNAFGFTANNAGMAGQFSTNAYIGNFGSSSYNGMLVSLRKNPSHGLEFTFNYTLSRSIDNVSSVANTVIGGLVCDATNFRVCRGPSDFDVTHLFSAYGVYDLPFGRGQAIGRGINKGLNVLIGGWQVAGIFTAHSGFAFSTNTGAFPVGFVFDSPAVLTGPASALSTHIHDANGRIQYFADPTTALGALSNPFGGEIGNRNNLRGPGFVNVDLSLIKKFQMPWSEQHSITFRADAYNVANHTNFSDPGANINSPTFGQITSQANPNRVLQLALRYDF
ncbi:MAG TPA: carboxypeptidase-like regulatory domain-containing protein [Candidatus Dormibacteraeota bacterium]|jgi:hypothetical protein|nr:carboxypeptidase-like regulatory domain-containing protein [Candidatus Dormibacteraeota bacterium]